jgi:hypothetical protein
VRLAGTRDVNGTEGTIAGLADARVEPEIPDQLARAREAVGVADDGDQRERRHGADAWDRHQPAHLGPSERFACELSLGELDLQRERVMEPQVAVDLLTLVRALASVPLHRTAGQFLPPD